MQVPVPVRVRRHAQAAKSNEAGNLEVVRLGRHGPAATRPLKRPLMEHTTATEQRGSVGTASKPISAAKTLAVPDMGAALDLHPPS